MNPQEVAQLEAMVFAGLSDNNDARNQAERAMDRLQTNNPNGMVFGLMTLLRSSQNQQVRSLCAVMLRNKLPNGEPELFRSLHDDLQKNVKAELLQALTKESSRYVQSLIGDTICAVAEVTLFRQANDGGWPELLPSLLQLVSPSVAANLRTAGYVILGKLQENNCDILQPQLAQIAGALKQGIASDSPLTIRLPAAVALVQTVMHTTSNADTKAFQPFIPGLLDVVQALLKAQDEEGCMELMREITELCTEVPTYFRPQLEAFSKLMVVIGQLPDIADRLRQLALEALVSLAESAAGMCRKSPVYLQSAVGLCFSMMLRVEEDDNWCKNPEAPELYDNSNFDCGEINIDRLAQHIGGTKLVPLCLPLISQFVGKDDWKFRHAGLKALSQVGEIVPFKSIPVPQIVGFLSNPHPRIRFAAVHCLGQLCTDFAPKIQQKYHAVMIPPIINLLDDSANPRNQVYAAAAIFNFADKAEAEQMDPYADIIYQKLLTQIKNGANPVKEQALTSISMVCSISPQAFLKYYDEVVPMTKQIIAQAKGKDLVSLRNRAMESVTFIGMHVGKDRFRKDAQDVIQLFVSYMKEKESHVDEASTQTVLSSWSRMCTILGDEFVPALPILMPTVLAEAAKEVDYSKHKDEATDGESPLQLRISNLPFTSQIEDKAMACSMLCSFVHELRQHFMPYIPNTLRVMLPLTKFYLNDSVRSFAITILPDIFTTVIEAHSKGTVDKATVQEIFKTIAAQIVECFKEEGDLEMMMTLVGSFKELIDSAGALAKEFLDENALKTSGQALLKLLTESHKRIQGRMQQKDQDEDYDEETEQFLTNLDESENELNFNVAECLSSLIKVFQAQFMSTFALVVPEILRMISPQSLPSTRKIGVYIFDDVVEHCGAAAVPSLPQFVPVLVKYLEDEDVALRQAAAYGLAMCAQHIPPQAFADYVQPVTKALIAGLQDPEAKHKDNLSPTDNMISALGKIAHFQNVPDLYPTWLSFMPLGEDKSESEFNYGLLCKLMEQNHPKLLGANGQNLAKIVSIFTEILGTEMCPEQIGVAIVQILRKLKVLPAQAIEQILATLKDDQKNTLRKVMSEA